MTYPLTRGFIAGSPVFLRSPHNINFEEIGPMVQSLISILPDKHAVINLCEKRINFTLAFLASILAKQTTILTSGTARSAIESVIEEHSESYIITDRKDYQQLYQNSSRVLYLDFEELSSTKPLDISPGFLSQEIDPAFEAVIIYTSGSTGKPSPNKKTWGSLVQGALSLSSSLAIHSERHSSILATVPPQHMFGLETSVLLSLQTGIPVFEGRPLLPSDIKSSYLEFTGRAMWIMTTPLQLKACVTEQITLQSVAGVISSTMALNPSIAQSIEKNWNTTVFEIYGSTETGMIAMRKTSEETIWETAKGVSVVTQDDRAYVFGGHIEHQTKLMDVIERIDEKHFRVIGRSGDLIKIGGKRMSLLAMNQLLQSFDEVEDGVFYIDEKRENHRMIAILVPGPGYDSNTFLHKLKDHLDPVFLPRKIYSVNELPREATGKLTAKALQELVLRLSPAKPLD